MDETYKTGSLPTAAFLLASGLQMQNYIQSGRHFDFVFLDKEGIARRAAQAYRKGASCCASDFYAAQIDIKRMMREAQGTEAQDRG